MNAISAGNPDVSASPLELRPVGPDDETLLQRMFADARPEFALLNLAESQRDQLLRMQMRAQANDYRASFPENQQSIILADEEPAGQIWIARQAGEIHVLDITVIPTFRRRGIGTRVYCDLIREANACGGVLRCSVSRFNPGSICFHESLGFKLAGEDELTLFLASPS